MAAATSSTNAGHIILRNFVGKNNIMTTWTPVVCCVVQLRCRAFAVTRTVQNKLLPKLLHERIEIAPRTNRSTNKLLHERMAPRRGVVHEWSLTSFRTLQMLTI